MLKKVTSSLALLFAGLMSLPAHGLAETPAGSESESKNYLTVSLGSHHFGVKSDGSRFNEFNPGIGYERVNPFFKDIGDGGLRLAYMAGVYHNSIERVTAYAGIGLEACTSLKNAFSACAGIAGGAATGYKNHPVVPMVLPYLKVEHNQTNIFTRVGLIPPIENVTPAVLTFQIGKSF